MASLDTEVKCIILEREIRALWWISITTIIEPFIREAEGGRGKNPLLSYLFHRSTIFYLFYFFLNLSSIEMHIPLLLSPVTVAFPAGSPPPLSLPNPQSQHPSHSIHQLPLYQISWGERREVVRVGWGWEALVRLREPGRPLKLRYKSLFFFPPSFLPLLYL